MHDTYSHRNLLGCLCAGIWCTHSCLQKVMVAQILLVLVIQRTSPGQPASLYDVCGVLGVFCTCEIFGSKRWYPVTQCMLSFRAAKMGLILTFRWWILQNELICSACVIMLLYGLHVSCIPVRAQKVFTAHNSRFQCLSPEPHLTRTKPAP